MNTKPPTAQQIGAALERAARAIAPLLVAAYVAGYMLGAAVHRLNDWFTYGPASAPAPAPAPAPTGAALATRGCIATYRAAGWSQQRIADLLGVSRTTVRRRIAAMA